eukprot:gene148-760_t
MAARRSIRLPPMPRISDIIRLYGLSAKKQLSQNFILDTNIADKVIKKADVFDCHVCEVGSGPGSLTRSALQAGIKHLAAVEVDTRFIPILEVMAEASLGFMSVHHADIMKFDITAALSNAIPVPWHFDDVPGVRLIGNLPFSVSIPLLLQWLDAVASRTGPFSLGRVPMTLVFQKEVAENLVADHRSYLRSRMSIMTQYLCSTRKLMALPRQVFVPEPNVDAWLVNIVPLKEPRIQAPFVVVEQVVKAAFSQRRKVIRTPLKSLFPENESLVEDLLWRANVKPTLRAHQLSMEDYDAICQTFLLLANKHGLSKTPLKVNKPKPVVKASKL